MIVSKSLVHPSVSSCAFGDYLTGKRPYTIWHRSRLTATLVTREQRGLFHLLVVPIRHAETILDLYDSEGEAIMRSLRVAAEVIERVAQPSGLAIWQNNGVAAAQTVPHVHFHIAGTIPREGTERGEVPELPLHKTQAIADALGPLPASKRA
jgi:histidine triad (HIT) family protein